MAVGTTAVRALQTVADQESVVNAGEGWTSLFITPERGVRTIYGLLTGMHEAHATHLGLLEALAGPCHLQEVYAESLQKYYLWH